MVSPLPAVHVAPADACFGRRPRALCFMATPSRQPFRVNHTRLRLSTQHICLAPPSHQVYRANAARMQAGHQPTPENNDKSDSYSNDNDTDDDDKDMRVYRSNGRARPAGELPFDVSVVSPPPRYLGRFQLDPATHCGDIVEHDGHHFEVKLVRWRYRLQRGRYRIVGKSIEVKSLARKAIEVYLEQKFRDS